MAFADQKIFGTRSSPPNHTLIMPRAQKSSGKSRHDPLLVQLDEDEVEAKYGRISQPGKRKKSKINSRNDDEDSSEVGLISSVIS